ncbi:MAG: homoserine O-acetyltransferase [Gemmatimonadetes bacterium]|nr:homoserine O-acetyltransferase [Gemmatimonadota bacterium]
MSATALREVPAIARYEITGPEGAPVILALGGISATRHVVRTGDDQTPGWWEGIVGRERPIDTTRFRVLSVDFRDGGRARDGRPAERITTHDQAAYIVGVLDELEIAQLSVAVGASYGGMVALALAERWPERVGRLVVISAAHEPHPMSIGLRAIQRRIVELGLDTGSSVEGMVLGRAVAMTTYRTAREFSERFGVTPEYSERGAEFEVERYLIAAGEKFAARMSPERFLALSLSVDLHRVVPESVTVPTTVIAARGDTLAPLAQMRAMSKRLPRLEGFHVLQTRFGHDAFLTEQRKLGRLLTDTLAD